MQKQMQMLLMLDASAYGDTKASGNGYDDMKFFFFFLYMGSLSTRLNFYGIYWLGIKRYWIWIMGHGLLDMDYGI